MSSPSIILPFIFFVIYSVNALAELKNDYSIVLTEKLARKYLAAPATSIPTERLFSDAGLVYTKKRNKLSGKRAEMLLFLKINLKHLNFEYDLWSLRILLMNIYAVWNQCGDYLAFWGAQISAQRIERVF